MASHEEEEEEARKMVEFPLDSNCYQILDEIGGGVLSGTVYKAICKPMNSTVVAIKAIDLDDHFDEAKTTNMSKLIHSDHPNILIAHCSFTVDRLRQLWVVMPFMSAGSLQSIISSSFPDGLSEPCIAIVLKETLKALSYLHDQGHLHRDVKAGNILIDSNGSVKLTVDDSNLAAGSSSSSGTAYWMAPEVIHSTTGRGYSLKADIWSFVITALELAHGSRPPLSHLPAPSKSLIMKITERYGLYSVVDYDQIKIKNLISKSFKSMVGLCLHQDPSKRPSAQKLLKHSFFNNNCNKGSDFLVKNVLPGLPTVEERFKIAKLLRLALLNITEVDHEDISARQNIKEIRITTAGWNFNVDRFELDPVVFPIDHSCREVMMGKLLFLIRSLDEQKQNVSNMIGLLRGEKINVQVSREELQMQVIQMLRIELDKLQLELEFLKLHLSN